MGMCAIYTAVKPPSEDELMTIARDNETRAYQARRCTVGRKAIAHLVALFAPPTRRYLVKLIVERDLWGFLTPAATRGNHAAMLQKVHDEVAVPSPLWPESVPLACLVGTLPAKYLGNNLVMLGPELVAVAVPAFEQHEETSDEALYLNEFLRSARDREDAVLLHWDYR